MDEGKRLDEQLAYYWARAGEYDEWFLREGRYLFRQILLRIERLAWHPT